MAGEFDIPLSGADYPETRAMPNINVRSEPTLSNSLTPNDGGSKATRIAADELRRLSLSPALSARLSPVPHGSYFPMQGLGLHRTQTSPFRGFLNRNRPAMLVALSQFFGALMNLSARLLELEGDGMHPVQALLLRQSLTSVCCFLYMWYMKTPDFPFGKREIRWLLILRGISGFAGVFGMWYSMMYLPLADATVITFLAPGVAGFLCYLLLREPFTRAEQLATLMAFLGVVLIAQPAALFQKSPKDETPVNGSAGHGGSSLPGLDHETTAEERLVAVGVALSGVAGAAVAFTTLRTIGKRAHPLISVNFFGIVCTIICISALVLGPALDIGQPALRWVTPTSAKQWLLLFMLGIMGFVMQYLLTAGLSADKSNKANAMVYTHMLFAASFDRWVFGHRMGPTSFAGCALILGSAIGVALMKKSAAPVKNDVERQGISTGEAEGSPMLVAIDGDAATIHMQRIQ